MWSRSRLTPSGKKRQITSLSPKSTHARLKTMRVWLIMTIWINWSRCSTKKDLKAILTKVLMIKKIRSKTSNMTNFASRMFIPLKKKTLSVWKIWEKCERWIVTLKMTMNKPKISNLTMKAFQCSCHPKSLRGDQIRWCAILTVIFWSRSEIRWSMSTCQTNT